MIYIKTYEGFIDKVKNLFKSKEEPDKHVDVEEVKNIIHDCFLELEDNRFSIIISHLVSRFGVHFDNEKNIFRVFISLTEKSDILGEEYPCNFTIGEIKDYILFAIDTIEDQYSFASATSESFYKNGITSSDPSITSGWPEYWFRLKGDIEHVKYKDIEEFPDRFVISEFDIEFIMDVIGPDPDIRSNL
jgi:hypothetical protein